MPKKPKKSKSKPNGSTDIFADGLRNLIKEEVQPILHKEVQPILHKIERVEERVVRVEEKVRPISENQDTLLNNIVEVKEELSSKIDVSIENTQAQFREVNKKLEKLEKRVS